MAQLTINLLGSFHVTAGITPLTHFRSDKARALLAYLAVEADRPHRREALAGLLWPDLPDTAARDNLRQTLLRLRQALGDSAPDSPPALLVTPKTIQFNRACGCALDVERFSSLVAACDRHAHRRAAACSSCAQRYAEAAQLYRGDLLDGFFLDSQPFEEWLLVRREFFHAQAVKALFALCQFAAQQGNLCDLERYARQQLALEPWREEAHAQLMRALAASGDRSAALAQYEICREALATGLGVEPGDEITQLYRRLLNGSLPGAANPPRASLPLAAQPLFGRTAEIAHIETCLEQADCRLLTLVGPGGIGKTRLALAAAAAVSANYTDGVWFFPLDQERAATHWVTELGKLLGVVFGEHTDPETQLSQFLRDKDILLVLDGCEALAGDAPARRFIRRILDETRQTRFLTTSRQRLDLRAEWLLPVEGLPLPDADAPPEQVLCSPALLLFGECARQSSPVFTLDLSNQRAVARICRLVAGAPLGIELAAGWCSLFSVEEIARQVERSLDFLSTTLQDVPARQRSLRAVFEHSWELLAAGEQSLCSRLAIFDGSFDHAAAAHTAGLALPALAALSAKSLLRPLAGDRLEIHPLLRQYLREKLLADPAEFQTTAAHHAAYFLQQAAAFTGPLTGDGQAGALAAMQRELANLRAAWEWAVSCARWELLAPAVDSVFLFFYITSRFAEGEQAFGGLASRLLQAGDSEPALTAKALAAWGWFLFQRGSLAQAGERLRESVALLRGQPAHPALPFCLNYLAAWFLHAGDLPQARACCAESLAISRAAGQRYDAAVALNILGRVEFLGNALPEARRACEESLQLARSLGNQWSMAFSLDYLGQIARAQAEFTAARYFSQQSLDIRRDMDDRRGQGLCLLDLADTSAAAGDSAAALPLYAEAAALFQRIGHLPGLYTAWLRRGAAASALGDINEARLAYRRALRAALDLQDTARAQDAQRALDPLETRVRSAAENQP